MPHFTVEYSSNLAVNHDVDALLDAIHSKVLELDFVPMTGIRLRGIPHDKTRIADGSDPNFAFVAIVARIGPGRDDATKRLLMDSVLDAAISQVESEDGPLLIAWSVEVQEIEAAFRVNKNNIATHLNNETY